ncbi:MAG: hypothetical protein ABSF71_05475 [Terriglobia bacterium]
MFPNRMDPARAKAASDRVLRRLTDPVIERSIDPVIGRPGAGSTDSEGVYRTPQIGDWVDKGQNRPPIRVISQEQMEGAAQRSADRSPSGEPGPSHQAKLPRIRVDVRIGASYEQIEESIVRQVYELEGTQLRTAIALSITPETVSRIMRRSDRRRVSPPQVPQAWPVVRPPEPTPEMNRDMGSSVHRVIDGGIPSRDQQMSNEQWDRAISGQWADEPVAHAIDEPTAHAEAPATYD